MTGLVRKATLLTISGVLAASAAMANVPSSANSTIGYTFCSSPTQCGIYLTGSKTGVADPAGQFVSPQTPRLQTGFRSMKAADRFQLHKNAESALAEVVPPWEQPGYVDGTLVS